MAKDSNSIEPDRVALATAVLLAADRQDRATNAEARTVEDVLATAGFTASEAHALLGGNFNTIKTRMRRARS